MKTENSLFGIRNCKEKFPFLEKEKGFLTIIVPEIFFLLSFATVKQTKLQMTSSVIIITSSMLKKHKKQIVGNKGRGRNGMKKGEMTSSFVIVTSSDLMTPFDEFVFVVGKRGYQRWIGDLSADSHTRKYQNAVLFIVMTNDDVISRTLLFYASLSCLFFSSLFFPSLLLFPSLHLYSLLFPFASLIFSSLCLLT